jgi:hypothetical protein
MEKFSEVLEKIRILLVENEITKEEFDHMVENLDGYYYENAILKKEKPQKASQNKTTKCEI